MLMQEALAFAHDVPQHQEESVFGWLGALRDELVGRGVAVGVPRQFCGDDLLVGYRMTLTYGTASYTLECRLQDERGVVMRVSFLDETQQLVLSYRANLGATIDMPQTALSRRLAEARKRVPLIASYFDQARTNGTLLH